jgi:restriction system protein
MQLEILSVLMGVIVGLYWAINLLPKQSRLHKINQRKAKRLLCNLQNVTRSPAHVFGLLRREDFFVFEELLLLCFQQRGFRIKKNLAYTGDGGIDGTFFDKSRNKFLIQAKRYRNSINPQHVTEFSEVIARERANGGFFIHTGRTGKKSYQNLTPLVRIISGNDLLVLLGAKLNKNTDI